ncbi:MAG: murein hydrolase activator EnvC family protein [Methylococcales bacterium]|jgi:septal ring factor EnvC (AmiA/AmiB activator)
MRKKLFLFLVLVARVTYGYTEELQSGNDLSLVESNIDTVKHSIAQLSEQKNSMQSLLSEIDKNYGQRAAILKKLQVTIEQKRQSLDTIHRDMDVHRSEIVSLNNELANQVRLAYALGQKEKLKLLLNQQDSVKSGRMMVYFKFFNQNRLKKLQDLEAAVKDLDQLDKERQVETEVLQQDLERKQAEQTSLNDARKQRNELLTRIDSDFISNEQRLAQLQESESRLRGLMTSLSDTEKALSVNTEQDKELSTSLANVSKTNTDFLSLKGKLPWPVVGKLSHKFGSARTEVAWDGVLIDAKEGLEVQAVTRGKVVFAEWFRSFGLMIIIDHGQGYLTLYGYNQSLYKKTGDAVEAGDVIASVGQSGGRNKAGLYFGIRNKGVPIDPLEWCRQ